MLKPVKIAKLQIAILQICITRGKIHHIWAESGPPWAESGPPLIATKLFSILPTLTCSFHLVVMDLAPPAQIKIQPI